jgi:hypothetical protein
VAGHIFQARPVWIYTQSNITNIIYNSIKPVSISLDITNVYTVPTFYKL